MKRSIFFLFGLCLNFFSSCSPSEAHSRGYVISQSQVEGKKADTPTLED